MYINEPGYLAIKEHLAQKNATLVAVSKTKPPEAIMALYELGHRHFGENYVQEITEKKGLLPVDINWHFIGHLQSNKVKYIAPFVHLIHGIDSIKLLKEVNKQALKQARIIDVLLQVHIAKEETKFGFDETELFSGEVKSILQESVSVRVKGLMGMASFSDDKELVRSEFRNLRRLFHALAQQKILNTDIQILSMGMSGDYIIAIEEGSTMVRIGSAIFGSR